MKDLYNPEKRCTFALRIINQHLKMKKTFQVLIAVAVLTIAFSVSMSSCRGDAHDTNPAEPERTHADTLIDEVLYGNEERLLVVIDSLLDAGETSVWRHANIRSSYARQHQDIQQAVDILKNALSQGEPHNFRDSLDYFLSVVNLAEALSGQSHYEEALKTASEVQEPIKALRVCYRRYDLLATLYQVIALSQYGLKMTTEADETAEEGYVYAQEALKLRQNAGAVEMSMTRVATTISKLQLSQRFDDAEKWIGRYDSLMKILEVREKDALTLDIYKAFGDIYHMTNALGQKQREKADSVYKEYLKTEYAKTYGGRVSSSDYFFQAERWSECADLLGDYEAYATSNGKDYSLDVLRNLSMKFIANYKAGRRDTALYVANNILEHIDSAIIRERESSATEMATIYETNKKDAEIAQQKIELSQQRLIGLIIAIVLLIIFFVIYTLLRRRSARRMAEIRAKQERIEGELQIARNIQMSMVPSQFPDYEGLDMYASMSPAKEVGGDLYGYVLLGNKLYIAIGDVSGKGVPASLFMAQATRLFRTLAAQQMMPAEICTRMNEALSGDDNESGMFVTFWLGLLDLKTGHLNFCNAGHNPPIVGGGENRGDFLEMIPNAPIGLWPGMEYEGEEIDTINGRPLFVYTDGVNEAENLLQEQFGDDRLLGILRTAHFDSAQQVVEMLKAEVEKHRDGAEPNDDLTMMCIFYETKDVTGGKSFITSCNGRHS